MTIAAATMDRREHVTGDRGRGDRPWPLALRELSCTLRDSRGMYLEARPPWCPSMSARTGSRAVRLALDAARIAAPGSRMRELSRKAGTAPPGSGHQGRPH